MASHSSLYHVALSHYSQGRYADASSALAPLLRTDGADADAFNLAAVCAYRMQLHEEAEAFWRRAIAARPLDADLRANLGNFLRERQRFTDAESAYRDALAIRPDFPEAHFHLAAMHTRAGRWPEAETAYRLALAAHPDYAEAHNDFGNLLHGLGRLDEARTHLERALAARPDWADAHYNLGNVLTASGRLPEAESAYRKAVWLRPDLAGAHNNLGGVLEALGRWKEAEAAYRSALGRRPDMSESCFNLGNAIYEQCASGRWDRLHEAEAAYRQALSIRPDFPAALGNLGILLKEHRGRLREAEALFRQASHIDPNADDARLNLATTLLRAGDYERGWPLFETRYGERLPQTHIRPPDLACPRWRGEPVAGKTLVVMAEQGFGDTLQFCRYLPLVKAQGVARLTVVCPPALVALIRSMDAVDICIAQADLHALPPADYWCFMMSLPMLMGTALDTIPAPLPYLRPSRERVAFWRERLPEGAPKIGLVWAGEPRPHLPDRFGTFSRRWLDARLLALLAALPGFAFVSLQKGPGARAQIDALPWSRRPLDPMDGVEDFNDTAALIASLDLVITVDTAVAHLAGALGRPTWILLGSNACWRWLEDRDDSPWYPSARLFRQAQPGNWEEVIGRVAAELSRFDVGN